MSDEADPIEVAPAEQVHGTVDNGYWLEVDFPFYAGNAAVRFKQGGAEVAIRRRMPARGSYEGTINGLPYGVTKMTAADELPGILVLFCSPLN